ncbi:MAG: hypothetical protein J6C79_04160 [Clostridia bacterium]|nr:hypothetical protein [Clostridia bacterium]
MITYFFHFVKCVKKDGKKPSFSKNLSHRVELNALIHDASAPFVNIPRW